MTIRQSLNTQARDLKLFLVHVCRHFSEERCTQIALAGIGKHTKNVCPFFCLIVLNWSSQTARTAMVLVAPIDLSERKFLSDAEARASLQIASNCSTDRPLVSLVICMTSIEPDVAAACAAFRGASAVMTVAPKRATMMASKAAVAMTVWRILFSPTMDIR